MKIGSQTGVYRRPFSIDRLQFYAPLWHPDLSGSPFISKDLNALSCDVTGATFGGTGRTFNGTTDTIVCTHHASQLLTTGGTISVWIKANTVGEGGASRIVDKTSDVNGANGYHLYAAESGANDLVRFKITDIGTVVPSANNAVVFGSGIFYHVTVTWINTGLSTIYVNGVVSGVPGISADPTGITTTNALTIGNRSTATDRTFDGIIGDVLIYSRALSAVEIYDLYLKSKWRYM